MQLSDLRGRTARLWREDERLRLIAGFAALLALLIPIDLALQVYFGMSTLSPLRWWLTANAWATDDSWRPMRAAYDWVRHAPDGTLYQQIFFTEHYKFQYAPTSLLPYAGLEAVGLHADPITLNRISRVLLLASAMGLGVLARVLMRPAAGKCGDPLVPTFGAIVTGAATLFYFPMTYGYQLGQLQVWNNAFFIFACLALVFEKRALAGVLLGLVCLMKPQLGVFALWGLLRRDWRFLAGLVATGVIGLGLSIALFGFKNHLAYLDALSYMARHGEAHLSNQSFNGLLHRLIGDDDGLSWSNAAFSPYNPIVYAGTILTSIPILFAGLWPRGPLQGVNGLMQFQLAALAFTIASPMAWEPHYGVLAPTLVTLFCLVLTMPAGAARRNWLWALAAAFVFSATYIPFVRVFAHTPLFVLQSYLLFAGLGTMVMLWRATAKQGAGASAEAVRRFGLTA